MATLFPIPLRVRHVEGTSGNDYLPGSSFADEILAGWGNDTLDGAGGSDSLFGEAGNDVLLGGNGADLNNGGAGIDTVDYATSGARVQVSLGSNTGQGGQAEGDTFVSIENVRGSHFGDFLAGTEDNNVLTGLSGNDYLFGGHGHDTQYGDAGNDTLGGGTGNDLLSGGDNDDQLEGGEGADTLSGGAGIDSANYIFSIGSVTIDLAAGTADGGHAAGDKLSGIENIFTGGYADLLIGSSAGNEFVAGGGADTLNGAGGADTLHGNTENDVLTGGTEADSFHFGAPHSGIHGYQPGDDVITDFALGEDRLVFTEGDVCPLITIDDLSFSEVNGNTVIGYDTGPGSITLVGVLLDDFLQHTATDLVFA
jgi:Ca2+-binding RTX toxin-like protein